jgi:hypothetical protein
MARVPISSQDSLYIAGRIAAFSAEAPETWQWLLPYVTEFAALPLYAGWLETIGLRADGEVVRWSTEGDYAGALPVEDSSWVLIGLVEGTRRYPELRSLLPRRGAKDPDCPCQRHALFVSGKIICSECCGLGWLSADDGSRSSGPTGGA